MGYLKSDILRISKSYHLYLGILGVVFTLFFSLEGRGFENGSVVFTYVFVTNLSGMLLTYVFSALPFATVFCEDIEQKYFYCEVVRDNLKKYVFSKCAVIYISSFITMLTGTILFLLICRTQIPWVNWDMTDLAIERAGCYGTLVENGYYMIYCILYASHLGMLSGWLSLMASLGSIYISNKVLVLVLPILWYQIANMVSGKGYGVQVFYATIKMFENDWINWGFILALSLILAGITTKLIYIGLKQRI